MSTREELELAKLEAEVTETRARTYWQSRKAEEETRQLARPWLKSPAAMSAVAPVLLALAGLVFSWSTGWFDTQRKALEATRSELQAKNSELLAKYSELDAKAVRIATETKLLDADKVRLTEEKHRISLEIKDQEAALAKLEKEKGGLLSENEALQSSNKEYSERAVKLQGEIARLQEDLQSKSEQLRTTEADRDAARERETVAIQRAPVATAIGLLMNSLDDANSPAAGALLRAIQDSGTSAYALGLIDERLNDQNLASDRRVCLLATRYKALGECADLEKMLTVPELLRAEYYCVRSFVSSVDVDSRWRLLDLVVNQEDVEEIGLSVLCQSIQDQRRLDLTPNQVATVTRVIDAGRSAAFDVENSSGSKISGAQTIASMAPLIGASVLLCAFERATDENVRLQIMANVEWLRFHVPSTGAVLKPSATDLASFDALRAWVQSQDQEIVKAACDGDIRALLLSDQAQSIFVHAPAAPAESKSSYGR